MTERAAPSHLTTFATVLAITGALYLARDVLIPVALAALLSFVLGPLAVRLQRWIGRIASVVTIVVLACGVVTGVGYLVTGQLAELAQMMPQYRDNITAKLGSLRVGVVEKTTQAMKEIEKEVQQKHAAQKEAEQKEEDAKNGKEPEPGAEPGATATEPTKVQVVEPEPTPFELLARATGPLLGPLGTAGMVIVLVVFMLLAREDLRDRVVRLMGRGRIRLTTQAMDEAAHHVSRYLSTQTVLNCVHGLAVAGGMFALGVPGFLLWGLLSALLRFVPYVGPWIAASMPLMVAFAVFDGWTSTLLVAGFFVVLELVSNNVLEPWLYGSSAGVSPLAVIVSAIFWTWLWGPVGLLLATPITVCLVVMGKYIPHLQFIHILLGNEPVLEPHARFYQRLVAMNQDEATEVAESYLAESGSLVETYDRVLLPALAMAENDRHAGDLDEQRSRYLHDALREIVADLAEIAASARVDAAADVAPAKAAAPTGEKPAKAAPPLPALPSDLTVVALPAHDEADELAGRMLVELVHACGGRGEATRRGEPAPAPGAMANDGERRIRVVSAVPPSAVAHARHVHKRLRREAPAGAVVVGLWTQGGRLDQVAPHLDPVVMTTIVASLRDAIGELARLARSVTVGAS
jgi:predicted PurR-regulated permease PerM